MYRGLLSYKHCAYDILVHVVVRWCSRTLEQENFASEISYETRVKCKDFEICTSILKVGDPLAI